MRWWGPEQPGGGQKALSPWALTTREKQTPVAEPSGLVSPAEHDSPFPRFTACLQLAAEDRDSLACSLHRCRFSHRSLRAAHRIAHEVTRDDPKALPVIVSCYKVQCPGAELGLAMGVRQHCASVVLRFRHVPPSQLHKEALPNAFKQNSLVACPIIPTLMIDTGR